MEMQDRDWAAIMERLLDGDRDALFEVSQLLTSFLIRWNAFDFQDDWDDLTQEVIIVTGIALREGKLRNRAATVGYIRSTARFKFVNLLKTRLRRREDQTLPWEEVVADSTDGDLGVEQGEELRRDLTNALKQLPKRRRDVVVAIHVQGKTYGEVSREMEIPLGTLKSDLKEGLAQLRRALQKGSKEK
jgi:RNA polymerase sigma-70 factor (ECF subfamily)